MKTLLGKDSKTDYQEFADIFYFFEKILAVDLPVNKNRPRIVETYLLSGIS
jgi:hypothetical protein